MAKRKTKVDYNPDDWAKLLERNRVNRARDPERLKRQNEVRRIRAFHLREAVRSNPEKLERLRQYHRQYYHKRISTEAGLIKVIAARRKAEEKRKTARASIARYQVRSPQIPQNLALRNTLYKQIWALIPANDSRDDIASEAMIALLTGEAATPAEAVKIGRKAHYRVFSQFGTVSMDAVMPSGFTLHDVLSVESIAC
ncbi:hypothetical protein M3484_20880 [Pseudomonas sp. GX19020]|uniref:hypothetical protein n=1 Tax=Pseudomonas sp. GX19020 TaxID=2942277 RepID=UPI002019CB7E|nr:hypothetical protein [Pseudomonas sp. GX19020]MCL4069016.1 hypothetical protein [Pseudomonas sp. GX19020]